MVFHVSSPNISPARMHIFPAFALTLTSVMPFLSQISKKYRLSFLFPSPFSPFSLPFRLTLSPKHYDAFSFSLCYLSQFVRWSAFFLLVLGFLGYAFTHLLLLLSSDPLAMSNDPFSFLSSSFALYQGFGLVFSLVNRLIGSSFSFISFCLSFLFSFSRDDACHVTSLSNHSQKTRQENMKKKDEIYDHPLSILVISYHL